ncbi:MAG: PaREP1 family protein [Candidatus Bathyarchaeia archaeon]
MGSEEEFLKDSYEFYRAAIKELQEGTREKNTVKLRDSAEKAWNAAVQAANALALKYTGLVPRSHYERRSALREVEQKVPELAKLGIYDRYAARSRLLHGEVFYEGVLDPNLLKIEIEKVFEFIEIAKAYIKPRGGAM